MSEVDEKFFKHHDEIEFLMNEINFIEKFYRKSLGNLRKTWGNLRKLESNKNMKFFWEIFKFFRKF